MTSSTLPAVGKRIVSIAADAARWRPPCRGIQPDEDSGGRFCRSCGYSLVDFGAWYRHGSVWRHPELGR